MHRGYARSPLGISTIFSSASFLDDFGLVCVNFPCSCSHRMHRNKLRFEWTPLKADIGYQRPYTKQKKASRREDGANPEGRTSVTPVHHRLQFCRIDIFVVSVWNILHHVCTCVYTRCSIGTCVYTRYSIGTVWRSGSDVDPPYTS